MSATEIIEELKSLPVPDQKLVKDFLEHRLAIGSQERMYDEFTLLGSDTEGSDVTYAEVAQAAVVRHGE